MRVTVYKFTCFNKVTYRYEEQPEMATHDWIASQNGCQIVLSSAREVDESELNNTGFYIPSGSAQ